MDYNYYQGIFELLAGISCCRNDNNSENLDRIWLNHKVVRDTVHESKIFQNMSYDFKVSSLSGIAINMF